MMTNVTISWITADSPPTIPWTSSDRTWRSPLRRRSMSAVRRASKYESGRSSRRPDTKSSVSPSSRTAARASIRRCARLIARPTNSSATISPTTRVTRPEFCVPAASTTFWVRTGASSCRPVATIAIAAANASLARNGRTNGSSHVRSRRSIGASSNRGVGRKVAHHPDHFSSTSARLIRRRPRAGSAIRTRSPSTAYTTTQWLPSQWMIAGNASSSRLSLEAFSARPSRPASSAASMIPRRLVPSCPVPATRRMKVSDTLRPKARQIIASAAAPQSAKSIWRTKGKRRGATHGSAGPGAAARWTPAAMRSSSDGGGGGGR